MTGSSPGEKQVLVLGMLCLAGAGIRYQVAGYSPFVAVLIAIGAGLLIRYSGAFTRLIGLEK